MKCCKLRDLEVGFPTWNVLMANIEKKCSIPQCGSIVSNEYNAQISLIKDPIIGCNYINTVVFSLSFCYSADSTVLINM